MLSKQLLKQLQPVLEEEELAAYAAAKEAKKQKAKAKRKQAQRPQSSSQSSQIDDSGSEQPAEADSAVIQSEAGSQSVQTASPGQTSAYAESSDVLLSPPQSVHADSSLDMYDTSAAVSTQEEGEQWVQAAATSKKGRAHKVKAMQQQAGLHWQPWSKPKSESQLSILPHSGLQTDLRLQSPGHVQPQTQHPVPFSSLAQSQFASQQDSQLPPHLQPQSVTGKRSKQSALSQGNAEKIAAASGDLPAWMLTHVEATLHFSCAVIAKALCCLGPCHQWNQFWCPEARSIVKISQPILELLLP